MSKLKYNDIKGNRYGRTVAHEYIGASNWLMLCDCGKEHIASHTNLKAGRISSCGCYRREFGVTAGKSTIKHGKSYDSIYSCWANILQRCLNKNDKNYHNYGGRGIFVCDAWLKFENFYSDMGDRAKGLSIERINNDDGYYKENCKWATMQEQANNKRNPWLKRRGMFTEVKEQV